MGAKISNCTWESGGCGKTARLQTWPNFCIETREAYNRPVRVFQSLLVTKTASHGLVHLRRGWATAATESRWADCRFLVILVFRGPPWGSKQEKPQGEILDISDVTGGLSVELQRTPVGGLESRCLAKNVASHLLPRI